MPKSSMFAEMPLDNRTVVLFATVAAIAGFFRLPDTPIQLVLICVITGIADIACIAPKTTRR